MVCLIVFKPCLPRPLSFHWDHDIYEACPACVRAHELRTCDGKTEVTFEICPRHRDTRDVGAGVESTSLDDGVLKDIRTLVHPLYSPVPTFPFGTSTSSITANSRDDLRKKVKVTVAAAGHNLVTHRSATTGEACFTATTGNGAPSSRGSESDLPWPEITYAHGDGCIYSPKPEVVLKPKAAVAFMDEYARERLKNITALLDSGISCSLGPGLDINAPDAYADADSLFGEGITTPGPSCTGCTTADPDVSVSALQTNMFVEAAAASEAQGFLRAEKKRLEACLATSSLAKGLYFKRCNGQWANAVDDVLVVDGGGRRGGGEGEGGCLASDEAVDGRRVKEEGEDGEMAAGTTEDAQLGSAAARSRRSQSHVGEELEAESPPPPPPPLTGVSTPSMTASDTAPTSLSPITPGSPESSTCRSSSSSRSNSSHVGGATAGPLSTTAWSTGCGLDEFIKRINHPYRSGYGYALLRHDGAAQSRMICPGTSSSSSSPSSLWTGGRACPPPAAEAPSFGYLVLQNREQMVRSSQCTEEDLSMTSWAFSRSVTTAAKENA